MRDPEDDPRLKELLRQVEAVDIPDYPDWKKGRRWGLTAGVAAGILIVLFLLVCGRLAQYGWTAAIIAITVFLVVWAIGSFRPQKL